MLGRWQGVPRQRRREARSFADVMRTIDAADAEVPRAADARREARRIDRRKSAKQIARRRVLLLFGGRIFALRRGFDALPRVGHRLRTERPRGAFRRALVLLVDLLGVAPLLRLRLFALGMRGGRRQEAEHHRRNYDPSHDHPSLLRPDHNSAAPSRWPMRRLLAGETRLDPLAGARCAAEATTFARISQT